MLKTREDFHLLPSVQHDFHRSDFHETLILARHVSFKKNFCTEIHDNRTIQSLSLRQRRTGERTRFTHGVHFFHFENNAHSTSCPAALCLSATNCGQLLPSPQRHADWYMCTDVSVKRCRRLVWHMNSARSVEAVLLQLGCKHGSPIRGRPRCIMRPAATCLNCVYGIKLHSNSSG